MRTPANSPEFQALFDRLAAIGRAMKLAKVETEQPAPAADTTETKTPRQRGSQKDREL